MYKLKEHIESLVARAAKATNGLEAMQYAQAAANAAKALDDMKMVGLFNLPRPKSREMVEGDL